MMLIVYTGYFFLEGVENGVQSQWKEHRLHRKN